MLTKVKYRKGMFHFFLPFKISKEICDTYRLAPMTLANLCASRPTGPHPMTRTSSPWTSNLSTPLWATPRGSSIVISSASTMKINTIENITERLIYEPPHEKPNVLHMRKQRRRSASRISAFVFATWIVQLLFFLDPKFQASSHLQKTVQPCVCQTWSESKLLVFSVFSKCGSIIISSASASNAYLKLLHAFNALPVWTHKSADLMVGIMPSKTVW